MISAWPFTKTRQAQIHPKKLRLAMALLGTNKHCRVAEIGRRHFNQTAQRCGFGGDVEAIIPAVVARPRAVASSVGANLPRGFPGKVFEVPLQHRVMPGIVEASTPVDAAN